MDAARPRVTLKEWGFILGVALALRVLVGLVLLRSMPLVHDAASYFDFAGELLTGFPGDKAYYWPPGNSYLLAGGFAIYGKSLSAARITMIVLGLGSVALTTLVAGRLTDDVRARRFAGFAAALYVPAVMLVGQTYAQHLAAFTLLAVAYFGLRAIEEGSLGSFAVAGVAFGFGVLTRPSMGSLAPFLLVACILQLRRSQPRWRWLAGGALFIALAAAIVIPVQLHNRAKGAGATISTNNERNLFLGNNPHTPNYKTSHLGQRSLDQLDPDTRVYLEGFYNRPDARDAMQKEAVDYIVHNPLKTAVRTFNRATSFWGFDYLASRIIQEDRGWGKKGLLPMLALEAGAYLAALVLAICGLFVFKDETSPFWRRWLLLLVLAYELPYMIAFSGGTYHFPVLGLLLPFAGVALANWRGLGERLKKSRGALLALLVFFLIQAQYAYYSLAMSG